MDPAGRSIISHHSYSDPESITISRPVKLFLKSDNPITETFRPSTLSYIHQEDRTALSEIVNLKYKKYYI